MSKIQVSVIGYGYWGPNHCRIVKHHKDAELRMICDQDKERLKEAREYYTDAICTTDIDSVLKDKETDVVIISTPVITHADIIKKALESGKHILCEKPLTKTVAEIDAIDNILKGTGKILMCAHTFEFNQVVRYIKQYLKGNDVGKYLYFSASRNGLGPVRKDINVIYDLASHDISIILFLLEKSPLYVSAVGSSCFNNGVEDIAFINLEFEGKLFASIQVSWLDPIKERIIRIVGSKKMLLFNDISLDEKLKIYNTGDSYLSFNGDFGTFQSQIKDGDIVIPNITYDEPLSIQFSHFIDCVRNNLKPTSGIDNARKVVEILEALDLSVKNNGERIKL